MVFNYNFHKLILRQYFTNKKKKQKFSKLYYELSIVNFTYIQY